MIHQPDWALVEKMVGLPDYGVAFCVSPWPDGGWIAGVVVIDRDWVTEQIIEKSGIDPLMLNVPDGTWPTTWDIFDGFKDGVIAAGDDAADAIDVLWAKIHGEANPPRRHERGSFDACRTASGANQPASE